MFAARILLCNPVYDSSSFAIIYIVQTSCGYGVPIYEYSGERHLHFKWAEKLGEEGLELYVHKKNLVSLDGSPYRSWAG